MENLKDEVPLGQRHRERGKGGSHRRRVLRVKEKQQVSRLLKEEHAQHVDGSAGGQGDGVAFKKRGSLYAYMHNPWMQIGVWGGPGVEERVGWRGLLGGKRAHM